MTMEEIAFEAEIIARLKELQQSNDIQLAYYQADSIICNLLKDFGYKDCQRI